MAVRPQRHKVDGVLLLDKPVGPSSSAVLQAVKRLLGAANKFAQFGLDAAKEYVADIRLGVATDTGDAEGAVIERQAVTVDETGLARALAGFRGRIRQGPPMY